jgi:hypothetical protein
VLDDLGGSVCGPRVSSVLDLQEEADLQETVAFATREVGSWAVSRGCRMRGQSGGWHG